MGTLYIVATPIGNLEDITLRALRVLREVSLIAAEDTRRTRLLLNRYAIKSPLTSYFEHSKLAKVEYIFGVLAKGDVALVSEAGTPGLNDPGYELITLAVQRGIPVVPVPGASIVVTALIVSGLPIDRFIYLGFLPSKASERRRFLREIGSESATLIMLEAPHRIASTLVDIKNILGERRLAVCREMTKLHEEVFRGKVSQAIDHFQAPRGEFALVVEGQPVKMEIDCMVKARQQLLKLQQSGLPARDAVPRVAAQTGLSHKELYRVWLALKAA